jgi:LuxR family maltose regulon positive regulatory protein
MLRAGMCAAGPAVMMADAAFAVAQEAARSPYRATAMWLLGQAHLLAGQLEEARTVFTEASAIAVEMGNFDTIPSAEAQLAWLAMDRGSWPEASGHVNLALATIEDHRMHDYACGVPAFGAAARLSLHHGDRKEADLQLARAMRSRPATTYLMPYLAVRARLQLAKVYLAIADAGTARQLLREIDDILRHRPALGTLNDDAEDLRRALDTIAAPQAGSPLPLTPAELRLLPYLQTHLTADMIAKRLFISIHTVKTEIKAIYRKLGVSSRDDAVRKAKEIGLLGD